MLRNPTAIPPFCRNFTPYIYAIIRPNVMTRPFSLQVVRFFLASRRLHTRVHNRVGQNGRSSGRIHQTQRQSVGSVLRQTGKPRRLDKRNH